MHDGSLLRSPRRPRSANSSSSRGKPPSNRKRKTLPAPAVLEPVTITGRGSDTGLPSALLQHDDAPLEPTLPSYIFAFAPVPTDDADLRDEGTDDDMDAFTQRNRTLRANDFCDDHELSPPPTAALDMLHLGFPAIKPLPYGLRAASVDPVALVANAIYAELADIHMTLAALAPAAPVVNHALIQEIYSWLGRGSELVTRLLLELFGSVLPDLQLPAHVAVACDRQAARARRAIAALGRSRDAFTPALPAGERLPVLMRAAARLRDIIVATTDVHARVQAALRANADQRKTNGMSLRAKKPVDLVQVECDSWRRLVGSVHTDRHGKGIAMPALLTRWMTPEQLQVHCRRHGRGLAGFRLEKLLKRMQREFDAQHRFIPAHIDAVIAEERAKVLKYNQDTSVTHAQWLEATRLSRLHAEQVIRNDRQVEPCHFEASRQSHTEPKALIAS